MWCKHLLWGAQQVPWDTTAHRHLSLSRDREKWPVLYLCFVRDVFELHCAELCSCVPSWGWCCKILTWWLTCVSLGQVLFQGCQLDETKREAFLHQVYTQLCAFENKVAEMLQQQYEPKPQVRRAEVVGLSWLPGDLHSEAPLKWGGKRNSSIGLQKEQLRSWWDSVVGSSNEMWTLRKQNL